MVCRIANEPSDHRQIGGGGIRAPLTYSGDRRRLPDFNPAVGDIDGHPVSSGGENVQEEETAAANAGGSYAPDYPYSDYPSTPGWMPLPDAPEDDDGLSGSYAGGACRPDPAMIDGLIATYVIYDGLPLRANASFAMSHASMVEIIKQSWISELQLALSQSCGEEIVTAQCFCASQGSPVEDVPTVNECMLAANCNANVNWGWSCAPDQDPVSAQLLRSLLQAHAVPTLVQWATAAGFAQKHITEAPDETDSAYAIRLQELLVNPLSQGRYGFQEGDYGMLKPDDTQSAAYVTKHQCPANTYSDIRPYYPPSGVTVSGSGPSMCIGCPRGKVSPAGSTGKSACEKDPPKDVAQATSECRANRGQCQMGCTLMPPTFELQCEDACSQRCTNCTLTVNPDVDATEAAEYCAPPSKALRWQSINMVTLAPTPPAPPPPSSPQHWTAEEWDSCIVDGEECYPLELYGTASAQPYLIMAHAPDESNSRPAWQFRYVVDAPVLHESDALHESDQSHAAAPRLAGGDVRVG
jgi:hypothetical protein